MERVGARDGTRKRRKMRFIRRTPQQFPGLPRDDQQKEALGALVTAVPRAVVGGVFDRGRKTGGKQPCPGCGERE